MIADTINYAVSYADCEKNNEASEVRFFESDIPKNPHCLSSKEKNCHCSIVLGLRLLQRGGSSPSFSLLSLESASSTPCDQLANSCSCTILSKNSNKSCDIVTFSDFFLRFISVMYNQTLHKILNMFQVVFGTAKENFVGALKNESNNSLRRSLRLYPNGDSMNASDIFNDGLNEILHALYVTDCNADIDELCSMLECDSRTVKINTVRLEHAKLITIYDLGRKYRLTDLGKHVSEICESIYDSLEGATA